MQCDKCGRVGCLHGHDCTLAELAKLRARYEHLRSCAKEERFKYNSNPNRTKIYKIDFRFKGNMDNAIDQAIKGV